MTFKSRKIATHRGSGWIGAIATLSPVCLSQGLFWGWAMGWNLSDAIAQPIAANDGTHTQVQQVGDRFHISGGTPSSDQSNLFHSFDQFDLGSHQIANFHSSPHIQTILGRVSSGNASIINGLIQVSGGSPDLFLMNPAGIVFGPHSRLDVPRNFTATTADGIGFNDTWFNALGDNDYANLLGSPNQYRFTSPEPGSLVNAGTLTVSNGSSLMLLGGTVANTGQLMARGGRVTVAAVPGEQYVRLHQDGMLLALEIEPIANTDLRANELPFTPLSLPDLLTGNASTHSSVDLVPATDLQVNNDGSIHLVGAARSVLTHPGTALVSGTVTTTSRNLALTPEINILGTHIALLDAELRASGHPGGTIRIGGDYQGQGNIPNAAFTYVDADTTLVANGVRSRDYPRLAMSSVSDASDGGRIILWADNTTQFYGNIRAQAHPSGGDGGFVEVSGHQNLVFSGTVDLTAPNGHAGQLLLDPQTITIVDGSGESGGSFESDTDGDRNPEPDSESDTSDAAADPVDDGDGSDGVDGIENEEDLSDGEVLDDDESIDDDDVITPVFGDENENGDGADNAIIFETALEEASKDATILLQADDGIILENLTDDTLSLENGLTLIADGDNDGVGGFTMAADDQIEVTNPLSNIVLSGAELTIGQLTVADGGNIRLTGDVIDLIGGDNSIRVNDTPMVDDAPMNWIELRPKTEGRAIALRSTTDESTTDDDATTDEPTVEQLDVLDITDITLAAIASDDDGFEQVILNGNETGNISIVSSDTPLDLDYSLQLQTGSGSITLGSRSIEATSLGLQSDTLNINLGDDDSIQVGTLLITNGTPGNSIRLADVADTDPHTLDLTLGDVGAFASAEELQIGDVTNTSAIELPADTSTLNLQIDLTLAASTFTRETDINWAGMLTIVTTNDLSTANISTTDGIRLSSNDGGQITTGNLTTSGEQGRNIQIETEGGITTGNINTSGSERDGGSVTLRASNDDIVVGWINTQGGSGGTGGTVEIKTDRLFRSTNATLIEETDTSILTSGGISNGDLTIRHGGGQASPFIVGDSAENGTVGAINTGSVQLLPVQRLPEEFNAGVLDDGNVSIVSEAIIPPPGIDEGDDSPDDPETIEPPTVSPSGPIASPLDVHGVELIETVFSSEFTEYLGLPPMENVSLVSSQLQLQRVEQQTGMRSAFIYVVFTPNLERREQENSSPDVPALRSDFSSSETVVIHEHEYIHEYQHEYEYVEGYDGKSQEMSEGMSDVMTELVVNVSEDSSWDAVLERFDQHVLSSGNWNAHDSDQLELLMVTSERDVIRRVIPGVTRANVINVARKYQQRLNRWQGSSSRYLPLAQMLYQWIVEPLVDDLDGQKIDNLLFSMDAGLRSLPVAALHDGEQFLVEQYSVGLVPSLTLTDMEYVNLQDSQVLALGASKFESLSSLPGVPLELSLITEELWPGTALLNEDATLNQLQKQQSTGNYGIVHLATHATFASGSPENSYIQLWDQPLHLDMFRELEWSRGTNTSLVVLSACQTALGNDEAELGFAGFAVQSGVQSALASLWNVNDLGTLLLMTEFYQKLQTSKTRAEALRQAQLSMLRGQARLDDGQLIWSRGEYEFPPELGWSRGQDFSHPYYWSGFTMVGSPW